MKNRSNQKGFTLLELLTVISIIGLVSSFIMANVQSARDKAKQAVALQFHAHTQRVLGVETVGAWEFDEGSGTTAYDSSGTGVNGTIAGAAYVAPGANGSGSALLFDGINDYVDGIGINPSGANEDITISAWTSPTDITGTRTIFTQGVVGVCSSFGLSLSATGKLSSESTSRAVASTQSLTNNSWQHTTLVYKLSGVVDTYINGVFSGSTPASTGACGGTAWRIGANVASGNFFSGKIDSVRVYNEALTATEVWHQYASEKQRILANSGSIKP